MPGMSEVILIFLAAMVILGPTRLPGALDRPNETRLADVILLAAFGAAIGFFIQIVALPLWRAGAWTRLGIVVAAACVWALAMSGGVPRALWIHLTAELPARRLRRRAARTARADAVEALQAGPLARVVGIVEADTLSRTRYRGRPAVVSHHSLRGHLGGLIDHGIDGDDFFLCLGDGTRIRVCAREAAAAGALRLVGGTRDSWAGRPVAQSAVGWFREEHIAEGDRVEVVGALRQEVDVRAAAARPRALPTSWTLIPPHRQPLVIVSTEESGRRHADSAGTPGRSP